MTLHPLRQAVWGLNWKHTVKKNDVDSHLCRDRFMSRFIVAFNISNMGFTSVAFYFKKEGLIGTPNANKHFLLGKMSMINLLISRIEYGISLRSFLFGKLLKLVHFKDWISSRFFFFHPEKVEGSWENILKQNSISIKE